MQHQVAPIGIVHSCFAEKFAIPRQPGLAPAAKGVLELYPPFNDPAAVQGLEQVSHIWLIFLFHQTLEDKPRLKVRPPRLGGNTQLGVFASRSTHRPNGLGQSLVRLERIEPGRLHLSGIDLVDGTPVLDIKPYLPFAECRPDAYNQIADAPPPKLSVLWQSPAYQEAERQQVRLAQPLIALIEQCLAQDPRPAYQEIDSTRLYGAPFWGVEVRWRYLSPSAIEVVALQGPQ